MSDDLDLFAGAGGWDEGIAPLDVRPLGIELNPDACATREVAGHRTLQADIAALEPADFAPCRLLLGSPPCPTFSTAGDQGGNLATDLILACANDLARGLDRREQTREAIRLRLLPTAKTPERAARDAAMTVLVVEPLRFALALRPEYVALEQVPAVLPLWRAFAHLVEAVGYRCWAGLLNAADYGVPQTRTRAFLLASRVGPVTPPAPTHCRGGALTFDGELAPWVSMAEALGWGMTARPSVSVVAGSQRQGGIAPLDGGSGSRAAVQGERDSGRWVQQSGQSVNGVGRAEREGDEPSVVIHGRADLNRWVQRERSGERSGEGFDPHAIPSQALTSKTRSWVVRTGANTMKHSRTGSRAGDGGVRVYERSVEEPAPTVDTKGTWVVHDIEAEPGTLFTNRGQDDHGNRQTRDGGSRAPTVSGKAGGQWVFERPATTQTTDGRCLGPHSGSKGESHSLNAIKITIEEAAILQGFPADYPWQGSRTSCFTQVGNAVCPPLARAVIATLLA